MSMYYKTLNHTKDKVFRMCPQYQPVPRSYLHPENNLLTSDHISRDSEKRYESYVYHVRNNAD